MFRRGSILILAIFFLFIVQLLAFAFVNLVPVEMNSAGHSRLKAGAILAAEAGLEYTIAYMENELRLGREPAPNGQLVRTRPLEGWNWTVTARADAQTPPNGSSNQRVYELTAEARQGPGQPVYARLRCSVMQESFAAYTRFDDKWLAGSVIGAGPAQIRGRFHTNDTLHIAIYEDFYRGPHPANWPAGPTFMGKVTAAGRANTPDGVEYRQQAGEEPPPYAASGNEKTRRYKALFEGGRPSLQTGVSQIPMPLNQNRQSLAQSAWGGVPAPQPNQVTFNSGAGIYVNGSVTQLVLSDPAGQARQTMQTALGKVTVIEVRSGTYTTPTGTMVTAGNTAILGPGAQERVFTGLPNGVVYVAGDISGLQGVNRGPHTLVCSGDMTMAKDGDLLQSSGPAADNTYVSGELPTTGQDPLGLFCDNFIVPKFYHDNDNLFLYAAIVCSNGSNGSLLVNDRDDSNNGTAKLVLVGSLVEDIRTYWASTQVAAGYGAVLQHDPHLLTSPPPNFPCTSHLKMHLAVYDSL